MSDSNPNHSVVEFANAFDHIGYLNDGDISLAKF